MYTSASSGSGEAAASTFAAPFHVDSGLLLFLTPFRLVWDNFDIDVKRCGTTSVKQQCKL